MTYKWILFDADETIFDFDDYTGLKRTIAKYGIKITDEDYTEYKKLNTQLFNKYQKGEIRAIDIKSTRLKKWGDIVNVSPLQLNQELLCNMLEICKPLPGAVKLLEFLKNRFKLGMITNGFIDLQEARLRRNGLFEVFDILVISENVGVAKPDSKIFEHAFTLMGNVSRKEILMVGDSPNSDILGGMRVGIDTCWINPENKPIPDNINPTYNIQKLNELKNLVL